jgi:hypothetical protein
MNINDLLAQKASKEAELVAITEQIKAAKKQKPKTNRQGMYLQIPDEGERFYTTDWRIDDYQWEGHDDLDKGYFQYGLCFLTHAAAEFELEKRRLLHDILAYCHEQGIELSDIHCEYPIFISLYCLCFENEGDMEKVESHFDYRIERANRDFVA